MWLGADYGRHLLADVTRLHGTAPLGWQGVDDAGMRGGHDTEEVRRPIGCINRKTGTRAGCRVSLAVGELPRGAGKGSGGVPATCCWRPGGMLWHGCWRRAHAGADEPQRGPPRPPPSVLRPCVTSAALARQVKTGPWCRPLRWKPGFHHLRRVRRLAFRSLHPN
jgi:hypothetical protein